VPASVRPLSRAPAHARRQRVTHGALARSRHEPRSGGKSHLVYRLLLRLDMIMSCPDCATARAARHLVFGDGAFWLHVWSVVLPFVITLLIVRAILRRVERADRALEGTRHD